MAMTPEQVEHIRSLTETFSLLAYNKYERGVREHGGNIWDKSALQLVEEAMFESIDQFIYLATLRKRLQSLDRKWEEDDGEQ